MGVLTGPKIPVFSGADAGDTYGPADMNRGWRMQQTLIQCNVIDIIDDPPVSPVDGDTYIVGTGTGAWAGHDNDIAYWTTQDLDNPSGVWEFYSPVAGWKASNQSDSLEYTFSGTAWEAALSSNQLLPTPGVGKFSLWTVGLGGASALASLGTCGDVPSLSTTGSAGTSGPFAPTANDDAYIKLEISANNSSVALLEGNSASSFVGQWWSGRETTFFVKIRYEDATSLLFQRTWIGLFTGDPFNVLITDTPTGNVLAFLNTSTGSATNWRAVTGGGSVTSFNSTVLGSTSVVTLKIVWVPGVSAKFYINGILVATNTTNLPSPAVALYPMVGIRGHDGAAAITEHLMSVYVSQTPV